MTREERKIAAEEFKEWRDSYYNKNKLPATMFIEEVIKILEQEPSEDCIKRQAVLDQTYLWSKDEFLRVTNPFDYLRKRINDLPSVNPQEPKYCDRNICVSNEYNGIGCNECEVTKSQEPKTEQENDYFRKIVEVAISQLRADRDRLEDELAKREQEPKTGHWMIVHRKGIYTHLVCDKCLSNAPYDCRTNYCPNCGAKMIAQEREG